jgi:hypothetical protein
MFVLPAVIREIIIQRQRWVFVKLGYVLENEQEMLIFILLVLLSLTEHVRTKRKILPKFVIYICKENKAFLWLNR